MPRLPFRPPRVSAAERAAGTSQALRSWSPYDVAGMARTGGAVSLGAPSVASVSNSTSATTIGTYTLTSSFLFPGGYPYAAGKVLFRYSADVVSGTLTVRLLGQGGSIATTTHTSDAEGWLGVEWLGDTDAVVPVAYVASGPWSDTGNSYGSSAFTVDGSDEIVFTLQAEFSVANVANVCAGVTGLCTSIPYVGS